MIKYNEQDITSQIGNVQPAKAPVKIIYHFHEQSKRRDKDNISAFFHKIFQDSFVRAGGLEDDRWDFINGYEDHFSIDKTDPRIEITILEDGEY